MAILLDTGCMGRSLAGVSEPAKRSAACGLTQVPFGGWKEFFLTGYVMGGGVKRAAGQPMSVGFTKGEGESQRCPHKGFIQEVSVLRAHGQRCRVIASRADAERVCRVWLRISRTCNQVQTSLGQALNWLRCPRHDGCAWHMHNQIRRWWGTQYFGDKPRGDRRLLHSFTYPSRCCVCMRICHRVCS